MSAIIKIMDSVLDLYPNNSSAKSTKKRYEQFLTILNEHEENGALIKAEFNALNSNFNQIVYNSFGYSGLKSLINHQENEKKDHDTNVFLDFFLDAIPSESRSLAKYEKEANKFKQNISYSKVNKNLHLCFDLSLELCSELLEYRDRLSILKDNIVKRVSAKEKKESEFTSISSHKDIVFAKEILDSIIEKMHTSIFTDNKAFVLQRYERIIKDIAKDNYVFDRFRSIKEETHQSAYAVSELLTVANIKDNILEIKDPSILNDQSDKEAERIYQYLKSFYIYRVSQKVGLILKNKNNLNNIDLLSFGVSNQIEASLKFNFKDDSHFSISTKVEWSTLPSDSSKMFMRIPTRFHDAVTPDGVKHTDLSEEYVKSLFIKSDSESVRSILLSKQNEINSVSPTKSKNTIK